MGDDDNTGDDGDYNFPTLTPSADSMPSPTDYEFGDDDKNNGNDGDGTFPTPVPSTDSVPSPTASSKDTVAAPGGTAKAGKKASKSKTSKVSKISKTQVRMKVHANPFS